MAQPGTFDPTLVKQGWVDPTLAAGAAGWFDEDFVAPPAAPGGPPAPIPVFTNQYRQRRA